MVNQVNRIHRQVIDDLPLHKRNAALLDGPEVDTPVCPLDGQQIEATPRRAQVITRTKLGTAALERFLNQLVEVHVECRGATCRHLNLAVFLATDLGCLTNCLPAFVPSRFALVVAAYSEEVSA